MKTNTITKEFTAETSSNSQKSDNKTVSIKIGNAYQALEDSMYAALETYSNVHRGSGHFSQVTTHLYERARQIVLDHLGLKPAKYIVIFCSPRRARAFSDSIKERIFKTVFSKDFGLNLGVAALAVRKNALPAATPFETGGGTTKLYGEDWAMWANAPDRFEAGTPAIINIIAFAKALLMMKKWGNDIFMQKPFEEFNAKKILYDDELKPYNGIGLLHLLRKNILGRNVLVPTTKGLQAFVNFDNSASTPTFTPVWDAFRRAYRQPGHIREDITLEVRQILADVMGAPLTRFYSLFTSNTTESINLVAQSLTNEPNDGIEPVILTTFLEHSSNDLPWRTVRNHEVIRLKVDMEGFFNLEDLEQLLRSYNIENRFGPKRIKLVAVSGASNVLGTCNNLMQIGGIVHRCGARLLVDAAQLVAHRSIDMDACGIDYLAFSGHKMYAPFGTGVLIVGKGLLNFNEDELTQINKSGEENTGGIAALGKILLLMQRIGFSLIHEEEQKLRSKALLEMSDIPAVKIHGIPPSGSLANGDKTGVIGFEVKGRMSSGIARQLARRSGIGVRFGCLCAHLIIKQLAGFTPFQEKVQRVALKMIPMLNLQGITRVSIGIQNTESDIDLLIHGLKCITGKQANGIQIETGGPANSEKETFTEKEIKQQIGEFIKSREYLVFGTVESNGR